MTDGTISWEDLRKSARKLENEVDVKLVSFTKLGTSFNNRENIADSSDNVPLLGEARSDQRIDIYILEIEELLFKLSDVINKMTDHIQSQGVAPNAAQAHALQRHREILQDYMHDFQKTKVNIQSCKDRDNLLGSVRRDIEAYKNSNRLTRRSELYLKENDHIRNSDRLVDEQITIAMEMKHSLANQRMTFKALQGKINTLLNRFPVINNLVQRINFRRRRDSIIVGLVIGSCLIILLLYAWH